MKLADAARIAGMYESWCEEKFEPDMGDWRNELSAEEAEIVAKWDEEDEQRYERLREQLAERDA